MFSYVAFDNQVVAAMVNNDLKSLVNTRPLKSWKETIALLCTVSLPFMRTFAFLCLKLFSVISIVLCSNFMRNFSLNVAIFLLFTLYFLI